jgi:hypothetical protein
MDAAAARDEQVAAHRIRDRWRIAAVDDDLEAAAGRTVLIAGYDLRNFGMELKANEAGPQDLNGRQFVVLRATIREGLPSFVVQCCVPPEDPFSFRLHANNAAALEVLAGNARVTTNEQETESFFYALCHGLKLDTVVVPDRGGDLVEVGTNRHAQRCMFCRSWVLEEEGLLLRRWKKNGWLVAHRECRTARSYAAAEHVDVVDEIVTARGTSVWNERNMIEQRVPLDTTFPSVQTWARYTPPDDYGTPPLRAPHLRNACAYLRAVGAFDRADTLPVRPRLKVVPGARTEDPRESAAPHITARKPEGTRGRPLVPPVRRTPARAEKSTAPVAVAEPCVIEHECNGARRRLDVTVPLWTDDQ